MNVLVTGGAGYIGSHATKRLCDGGARVVVVDDLSRGHRSAVHKAATLIVADVRDTETLTATMRDHSIDAVMHFAALSLVGESVEQPALYWHVNVGGSASVLQAMAAADVHQIVFSSSCSVYGEPSDVPILEGCPRAPVSPYGRTKAAVEDMLIDAGNARPDFSWTALRYFNVAGCDSDGVLGEDHIPETHLIPIVLQAAVGERDGVSIFGCDYPTFDGTCVRDYVHVDDLVDAHVAALANAHDGDARALNLGIGSGFSVRQVIEAVKRVTGAEFPVRQAARRPGDPPELYASSQLAYEQLGWRPRYTSIDAIVQTAWDWKRNVGSYSD